MQSELQKVAVGKLQLPHPYLTTYFAVPLEGKKNRDDLLQVVKPQEESSFLALERDDLYFTAPVVPSHTVSPPVSDNTPWGRAQRAASSIFTWEGSKAPSLSQIWLLVYMILTVQPENEIFRVELEGSGGDDLKAQLRASMLATDHPARSSNTTSPQPRHSTELVFIRSAFWQGAASPFGTNSPWTPSSITQSAIQPPTLIFTTGFPDARVHVQHPLRPQKPQPGSVVYSRYIASLDEVFSLIALDYTSPEHLDYFHTWQNDPRVAKGWNETGTLEEHRDYLRRQHEDAHTLPVLGRFTSTKSGQTTTTTFSYFEIFYAKEDHAGAHYPAGEYDRGRHSLVGDARFRGPHRALAWWSCIVHFCFLDDMRTEFVIGEPIATNAQVLVYDYTHGFHVDRFVDFPHKRAALVKCSRHRFFQLSPLCQGGGHIAGTRVPLPAKI